MLQVKVTIDFEAEDNIEVSEIIKYLNCIIGENKDLPAGVKTVRISKHKIKLLPDIKETE